jgi:hypothetical protein
MSDRYDDELNRFWNEFNEHGTTAAPDLDAGDAMLVHRLQSLAAASLPGAARERVWRGLLDSWQPTAERKEPPMNIATSPPPTAPPHANGKSAARPVALASRRQPAWLCRPILRYAAAAILVLGIVLAFDLIRDSRNDSGNRPAIMAPASPEPTAESTGDTVLETTIPADVIPTSGFDGAGFAVFTIPVGNRSTWEDSCCAGPLIEHVVSGMLTVRDAMAVQVVRADKKVVDVPAGSEVTLKAGDTLIARLESTREVANTGTEPVVLASFVAVEENWYLFNGNLLPGWQLEVKDALNEPLPFRNEPIVVQLRKTTVMNGESIPAPPSGYLFVNPPFDGGFVARHSDGSVQVFGQVGQPVEAYALTLTQSGDSGSTPSP